MSSYLEGRKVELVKTYKISLPGYFPIELPKGIILESTGYLDTSQSSGHCYLLCISGDGDLYSIDVSALRLLT